MRAFLLFLLFLAFLLLGRWYFVCEVRQMCGPELQEDVRLNTLLFRDGDSIVLRGYDHFKFPDGSTQPELNENNRTFLDEVAQYLLRKPDKNLTITGRYTEAEDTIEIGIYENIGVARAEVLRKALRRRGLEVERISLDYQLDETNSLRRPVAFDAFLADSSEYEKQAFTFTNMSFTDANFEFGSAEFYPGPSCVTYMDSVETYMSLNEKSTLTIVGHTDSIDTDAFNYRLGMERAKSTREYMMTLGVPEERIEVASEGEQKPVAPNRTSEGRQKNRRVVFIINEADE